MTKVMDYIANGGDELAREKAAHEYTQGTLGVVMDENKRLQDGLMAIATGDMDARQMRNSAIVALADIGVSLKRYVDGK